MDEEESSTTTTDKRQSEKCCAYCGLPPRISPSTGKLIKLKRCSRCQQAWYHDAQCQKSHFPQHKQECIKASQQNRRSLQLQTQTPVSFKIERRPDRGRCLIAAKNIPKGQKISNNASSQPPDDNIWEPLGGVPPVLHPSQRSSRCALCFGTLIHAPIRFQSNRQVPQYQLLFCSSTCRDTGVKLKMDEEVEAVSTICNDGSGGPPEIFSTAILLFRLVILLLRQQSKTVRSHWDDLQHNNEIFTENESVSASFHHTQVVLATVTAMIQASPSNDAISVSLDELRVFVSKIKLNGFSISDGESIALGVGIYSIPSAMNHSCGPNAIQTFTYGQPGSLPSLMVTACQDISAGQEICISYTDVTCPSHIRQERLFQDYHFQCSCQVCKDIQEETVRTGLRCLKCSARPVVSHAPSPVGYKCESCDNQDFAKQENAIMTFLNRGGGQTTLSLEDMERDYGTFKRFCFPDSWYVQESGERLVQAYLDLLGAESKNESRQRELGTRALEILEELRTSSRKTSSTVLRDCLLSYKAAKLRLFLIPDPRQSMAELQSIMTTLSNYYTPSHEIMLGLRQTLQQAMG